MNFEIPKMYYLPHTAIGQLDTIYHLDALALLRALPDACVDMALMDLPYGVTAHTWDSIIPLDLLWHQLKRILKQRGAAVFTATQPFTSMLVMSNLAWYRDEWIYEKSNTTRFLDANRRPMQTHESVLVFGGMLPMYYPQMGKGKPYKSIRKDNPAHVQDRKAVRISGDYDGTRYPKSIIRFPMGNSNKTHPTQKPVALFSYLIRTYTQPGDVVLDPVVGSGTTAIAARNCNRRFICGDLDAGYVEIARKRLAQPFTRDMFDHTPQSVTDQMEVNTKAQLFEYAGLEVEGK